MKKKQGVFVKAARLLMVTAMVGGSIFGCGRSEKEEETKDSGGEKKTEAAKEPNEETIGLKAYYSLKEIKGSVKLEDESGNGYDAMIYNKNNMHTEYEKGAAFFSDGAYLEMPADIFKGEDTLTISIWLKSYSGAINTSAVYFAPIARPLAAG